MIDRYKSGSIHGPKILNGIVSNIVVFVGDKFIHEIRIYPTFVEFFIDGDDNGHRKTFTNLKDTLEFMKDLYAADEEENEDEDEDEDY